MATTSETTRISMRVRESKPQVADALSLTTKDFHLRPEPDSHPRPHSHSNSRSHSRSHSHSIRLSDAAEVIEIIPLIFGLVSTILDIIPD
jgi:hypothetical protein